MGAWIRRVDCVSCGITIERVYHWELADEILNHIKKEHVGKKIEFKEIEPRYAYWMESA